MYCLLDRFWKISSETEKKEQEVKILRIILAKNKYPDHVVEQEIGEFIENRHRLII